ncbi:MAG: mechanosensitive ion channel [Nitrososphaeria archaeon]|nr:mechanosensitive ion channel [Nitrososphaeria archaeon]
MSKNKNSTVKEKIQSYKRSSIKIVSYLIVLIVIVVILNYFFRWSTYEEIPENLKQYSNIILLINPYIIYVYAALVFGFGYLITNTISGIVYRYFIRLTDYPTASTFRTLTKIVGIGVLLTVVASILNVNPATALTIGSFGGLVVGFATQTVLSHLIAGIFILITKPFTFGDVITISGQTGVVKEIRLMHLVLDSLDGSSEILIPCGNVITQILLKRKPPMQVKPIKTLLVLEEPPKSVKTGTVLTLKGKLVEAESGKPIPNMIIKIFDEDISRDALLATGNTDENGVFVINWQARTTDLFDNTVELYAKFEGTDDYRQSKSDVYVIEVV